MRTFDLVSGADASVSVSSVQLDLGDLLNMSIHVDFSGATLAGTLKLQASNDNSDYVDVTGSSQVVASAASHIWVITNAAYRYVKVVWTPSGGTGTITVKAILKESIIKGA